VIEATVAIYEQQLQRAPGHRGMAGAAAQESREHRSRQGSR
jgi:hypothetical protein